MKRLLVLALMGAMSLSLSACWWGPHHDRGGWDRGGHGGGMHGGPGGGGPGGGGGWGH